MKHNKYLKLNLNENIYAPTEQIFKTLKTSSFKEVVNSYPNYDELKNKLSKYLKVASNKIFVTNGADQAIDLLNKHLFKKGDKVIIPSPNFFVHYHFLKLNKLTAISVRYKYNKASASWDFPYEEITKKLNRAQGLILVNPNNPLGALIPEKTIKVLLKEAYKKNIYVIVDEAYFEFSGKSVQSLLSKYNKLIIIRTFSKFFGLAGLRLGYVIANPNIISILKKSVSPWEVSHFAVYAGINSLKKVKYFDKVRNQIIEARSDLYKFFIEKDIETWSSDTNFLVIKHNKSSQIIRQLKKNHILVANLGSYPNSNNFLKNAIRITIPIGEDLRYFKRVFNQIIK